MDHWPLVYNNRTGAIQKQSAAYGQGSGYIVLDDVDCRGPETSIASCRHYGYKHNNCGHDEDVGVVCCRYISCTLNHPSLLYPLSLKDACIKQRIILFLAWP